MFKWGLIFLLFNTSLFGMELRMATVNWPPYFGESMKEGGPMVAVTREILKRKEIKLKVDFIPWKRAVKLSMRGEYDALFGAYKTKEREKTLYFTDGILASGHAMFSLSGRTDIPTSEKNLEKFKNFSFCLGRGYSVSESFDKATFLDKKMVNNATQCISMLEKKRIDFFVEDPLVFKYEFKKLSPDKEFKFKQVGKPLKTQFLHIAFSRKMKGFKKYGEIINKGLKELKADGTYQKILEGY